MFFRNVKEYDTRFYIEAAKRCGFRITMTEPMIPAIEDSKSFVNYKAIHIPTWLTGNALVSFQSTLDATIAEGVNMVVDKKPHLDQNIVKAFCVACDAEYDPREELDPVDHQVWADFFMRGITGPALAVQQYRGSIAA